MQLCLPANWTAVPTVAASIIAASATADGPVQSVSWCRHHAIHVAASTDSASTALASAPRDGTANTAR